MKNSTPFIKKQKKPWPTKAAMEQVYDQKLWGGKETDFYSGTGSYELALVNPYIDALTLFFQSLPQPPVVCDLGCGDFNVGQHLVKHTKKYVAVDIVPALIARNKEKFKQENLEFRCLDIAKDKLPKADCALIRQVLQHLSNQEVLYILNQLKSFKYVILTEHVPLGHFNPNQDIISGQGTRLKKQSGISLLAPPFNFKVKTVKEVRSISLKDGKSCLRTMLFEVF